MQVRQREEHLKSLPNIWDPETEKKAREPEKFRTRADHAGKPTEFPPGTEGMLGRQYTEVPPKFYSQVFICHAGR